MTSSNTAMPTYGTQMPYNESICNKEIQSIQHRNQSFKIKWVSHTWYAIYD